MSQSLETTLRYCPTCNGAGRLEQNGGSITCSTCDGNSVWLETASGKHLLYNAPLYPQKEHHSSYLIALHYAALILGSFGALFALFLLFQEPNQTLATLFWSKGWPSLLFGVSGSALMYGLTTTGQKKRSQLSLDDLVKNSADPAIPGPILLNPYANPRITDLLVNATEVASALQQSSVDSLVLILTLFQHPRIQSMLLRLELHPQSLCDEIAYQIKNRPAAQVSPNPNLDISVRVRLHQAAQEALRNGFPYIDAEDLLLAYLRQPDGLELIFNKYNLEISEFLAVSQWYAQDEERRLQWSFWLEKGRSRPHGYMNRAWTALPTRFLDGYSTDITRLAANGQVNSASAHAHEVQNVLEILGRTQKNSVLLVGEPGVGKNTVLGAVALQMIEDKVPDILKDKRLVSLDLGALLADTARAEENVQSILNEVSQAGNVILAIPDIHMLVGTSSGALDAAALLSTALNRGYIQVISTASYADYHRYVESSPNLSNILDTVEIKELNEEQAIAVLEEEAPLIEGRQKVSLTYPAIKAAAQLSKRYTPDKALPQSAISLLDQAASSAQISGRHIILKADVEATMQQQTGIPIGESNAAQSDKLLHLEDELHKRLIGQNEAVTAVAEAIRRSAAGLHDEKRPIASLLFVGPTGVGKTETAKALTELYFGNAKSMIRLDMSEYQEPNSVYRLIGAPATSSESYTEGGALTQPIREHPHSLILLDELEKAHPDVLNLFLQLLDDGRLTENTGRTVHFSNTIIIATSNAGSGELIQLLNQGVSGDELDKASLQLLQKYFKPEFINRFDRIIPFHPLTSSEVQQVAELLLSQLTQKMAEQKYSISFTPAAVQYLAEAGFDPTFGARPLRRVIQDKAEGYLARLILERRLIPGQSLQITPEMLQ